MVVVCGLLVSGCGAGAPANTPPPGLPAVLAIETFLADLAQNVAGDRLIVGALLPIGADPHSFEPAPADVARVAKSTVLIANGAGFEAFLDRLTRNAGGQRLLIEASAGLTPRTAKPGEPVDAGDAVDPHFWLDPINAVAYVENIRAGLTKADPAGAPVYAANAAAYSQKLRDLDAWIRQQVDTIPPAQRLMVTNHESFGYFADRYALRVVGSIVASVSSSASPSAQELAQLINSIKQTGARAIFLESGANPQLAKQLTQETGAKTVEGLYTHSLSQGGPAATYIDMMKYDTGAIVNALK